MIRRYSPRSPRRPYQDFHFFAASDPIANIEAQFARPPHTLDAQPAAPPEPAPVESPLESKDASAPATLAKSNPSTQSGPPYMMPITVLPENIPDLDRRLSALQHEQDDRDEDEADEDGDEPEETDLVAAAEGLGRTINSLEKIRAAVALGRPEPPAIDELDALQRKRKRTPDKGKSAPKSGGRRSAARLATPRKPRSRKPRRALVFQPRASHQDQCTICAHQYRAEIEDEFMHWHTLGHIAYDYKVSRSAIYRHAYALGLFSRRDRLLRFSLGHLIERVQDVEPTADSIVRAVHLFSRINDQGECVEPPAHVIVSSGGVRREAVAQSGRRPIAIQLDSPALTGEVIEPPADGVSQPENASVKDATDASDRGGTVNRP